MEYLIPIYIVSVIIWLAIMFFILRQDYNAGVPIDISMSFIAICIAAFVPVLNSAILCVGVIGILGEFLSEDFVFFTIKKKD